MSELLVNKGIQTKCDGCHRKIKATDERETISGDSDGQFFVKTLCTICIKDVVEKFRAHLKAKEEANENKVCL